MQTHDAKKVVEKVVIRFAGDSGDGMQLTGSQFTRTSALAGNDLATLPDYPAEIRAPAGTREGVSAFQLQFASVSIFTPGDIADVLVAMNPAALVTNLQNLRKGGVVIVNTDKFTDRDNAKARVEGDPLADDALNAYTVIKAPISSTTRRVVEAFGLNAKEADRCKNFFALGMAYWMYSRDPAATIEWIGGKFKAPYADANVAALHAGLHYAETAEIFQSPYEVPPAPLPSGQYRNVTGNHATALGLAAGAARADRPLFYGTYPITPASDILHHLAKFKQFGVVTFQAEDEIAAVGSAIGASYGGAIGVTGTSGPGLALKAEAIGLAVAAELPLIVVNVQRAGPSTGMPTKPEQADLMQAMYGRNGESPCVVLAPATPADCFDIAVQAVAIATQRMVPVIIMSDGYVANGAEPWRIPHLDSLPDLRPTFRTDPEGYQPFDRDPETLARDWVLPGTKDMEHRLGGLERGRGDGNVSYDPDNHQLMSEERRDKVLRVANMIGPTEVVGDDSGLLVLAWGSTYGAVRTAVHEARAEGLKVAHAHLRSLHPFPSDLGEVLKRYDKVIVPELNLGQLCMLIRAQFLIDATPVSKIQGQPFKTHELLSHIRDLA